MPDAELPQADRVPPTAEATAPQPTEYIPQPPAGAQPSTDYIPQPPAAQQPTDYVPQPPPTGTFAPQPGRQPFAAPPNGYPSYPPPNGHYPPQYGHAPAPYPPHGYQTAPYPPVPLRMPGTVRAAQIISFLMAGLGILLGTVAGALGKFELLGALVFGFSPALVLGILAFSFGYAHRGTRISSIVLGSFLALFGLNPTSPPGLLGLIMGITIVVLLAQGSAGAWFNRPRPETEAY
ncbi:hypothetical protein [Nocardia sp. NPDC052566]|uniref:hypothetical protein n=1 Tax=Nocardia sp. NPDC052566 TaxID=3364330 RepID=UPI0037C99A2D